MKIKYYRDGIERLRFLASFHLPGKREGGEKTQPFNRFVSHPVISTCDVITLNSTVLTIILVFSLLI